MAFEIEIVNLEKETTLGNITRSVPFVQTHSTVFRCPDRLRIGRSLAEQPGVATKQSISEVSSKREEEDLVPAAEEAVTESEASWNDDG